MFLKTKKIWAEKGKLSSEKILAYFCNFIE